MENEREEEERLRKNYFNAIVRLIDFYDIVGMEDALEMKQRTYSVRCTSATSEVYKINTNVFFS